MVGFSRDTDNKGAILTTDNEGLIAGVTKEGPHPDHGIPVGYDDAQAIIDKSRKFLARPEQSASLSGSRPPRDDITEYAWFQEFQKNMEKEKARRSQA